MWVGGEGGGGREAHVPEGGGGWAREEGWTVRPSLRCASHSPTPSATTALVHWAPCLGHALHAHLTDILFVDSPPISQVLSRHLRSCLLPYFTAKKLEFHGEMVIHTISDNSNGQPLFFLILT